MTTSQYLLAVEGGGTNTQALIADLEGTVLARGLGPSSNLHNVGFEKGLQAIATAIEGALAQVRGTMPAAANASGSGRWRSAGIVAACLGLSGVDSSADGAQVSQWLKDQALAPRLVVVNDSELVLAAGTPAGWGAAPISGTPPAAQRGRNGAGRRLGAAAGDEGAVTTSPVSPCAAPPPRTIGSKGPAEGDPPPWKLKEPR